MDDDKQKTIDWFKGFSPRRRRGSSNRPALADDTPQGAMRERMENDGYVGNGRSGSLAGT